MELTWHLLTEDVGWRQALSVVDAVVEDAHDAAAGDGPDEDVAVVARRRHDVLAVHRQRRDVVLMLRLPLAHDVVVMLTQKKQTACLSAYCTSTCRLVIRLIVYDTFKKKRTNLHV